jgi:hypothetical protein
VRNETTPSSCQNFAPSTAAVLPEHHQPSDHPAVLQECPPTSTSAPPSSVRAPLLLPMDRRRLPLGPRPFSPWTAAVVRGRPADLLPERRHPSSPRRMTSSSPRAAFPTAAADSSAAPLPPMPHLLPLSPWNTSRPGMGPAVQRRLPPLEAWFVFSHFFFFKMQLHVIRKIDYGLWINRFIL